ncbi:MAG: bifunctional riboflavin kinase/FAD synthetase [Clostridiales bacterium]|nr:bifunctional riboflavin kinase/FAD synthetase [Clostridiales bacterium]MCF8022184.1 bifunctional riboflavin kinase/FAD synthetase [Clostridiales bacterium]
MKIYRDWTDVTGKYENLAVALGNFDGVHLGHKRLIQNLIAKAQEEQVASSILTFHPHPSAVLNPENTPPMLLTQEAKQEKISNLGVDIMIKSRFTSEFAKMTPEEFVCRVLKESLHARWVFIGYNYNFGYKGRGNPDLLKALGDKYGFSVHIMPPVSIDGQVVSSTLIRNILSDGDTVLARKFLGCIPCVEGYVISGQKLGRKLGFPTANLEIDSRIMVPANGVYTVKVLIDKDEFIGVANIGVKPTFQGETQKRNIEVHLLNFCSDLYGKKIKVCFIRRLRGERRFSSASELIDQIEQDIYYARAELE